MKNGFIKGLILGIGLCLVVGLGIKVGTGISRYKNSVRTDKIGFGTPTPTPESASKTDNKTESTVSTPVPTKVAEVTKSVTMTGAPKITPSLSPTPTPILDPLSQNPVLDQALVDKIDFLEYVINTYYYKEVSSENIRNGIYKGMMDGIGDEYTVYYTPKEYNDLQQSTSGVYGGVGSYISKKTDSEYAIFLNPFKGGPAEKAGIQSEDIIYKVEGEIVLGMTTEEIANRVRGKVGTTVHLTVYRSSSDKYIEFEIVRAIVNAPTVETEMLEGNVGYISVSEFAGVTEKQFIEAVDEMLAQKAVGLVIDLRNNGGGVLDVCVNMVDYILPDNKLITYTLDKQNEGEKYMSKDGHQVDLPIVILVNGYSASASEVFTGALSDNDCATVMGTTSFGKGIVQSIIPLNDGSAIKITTSSYYTPSGVCIHGIGITPDIVVELTEPDNQKEAARKQILGQ